MARFWLLLGLFSVPLVWMTVLYGFGGSPAGMLGVALGLGLVSALLGRALLRIDGR